MKITYIKLKNFSAINTGMHKKVLEIDFSKSINNIILLVGVNGSGKTALQSTLHPFAYPGNMDVRANATMILEDHDGEKEIHYDKDGTEYIIHHYYKSTKKSMTVKSFIARDGEELNPNGNVTSFNEIVYNELGIQQEYLKLMRLGSNVTNFIELKAAERKNFTSDLFSDLDILTGLFKKVNDDYRTLKNLLNTVSNKIQRLGVTDIDELKTKIEVISCDIKRHESDIEQLNKQAGVIEGRVTTIIPEGIDVAKNTIKELKNEFKEKMNVIRKLNKELQSVCIIFDGSLDEEIKRIGDATIEIDTSMKLTQETLDKCQIDLNDAMNELSDVNNTLKSMSSTDDVNDLKSLRDSIKDDIESIPKRIKEYDSSVSKSDLLSAINILNEIDRICSNIYEFGTDAIKDCLNYMESYSGVDGVDKAIGDEVAKLDKKISNIESKTKVVDAKSQCLVIFRPPTCVDDNCPYLDLYNRLFTNDEKKESVTSLNDRRDYLMRISAVNKNINYIAMIIGANKNICEALSSINIDYLDFKSIVHRLSHGTNIFDESDIVHHIDIIENHDRYLGLVSKLKDVELELASSNTNDSQIAVYKEKKRHLTDKVNALTTDRDNLITKLNELKDLSELNKDDIEKMNFYEKISREIDSVSEETNIIGDRIRIKEDAIESVSNSITDLAMIKDQIESRTKSLELLKRDLFNAQYTFKSYNMLTAEREILNTKFENVSITKESLSSNKGVPLLYMQLYLQSTVMFVNNILETVYDNFSIDGFEISENEFNIPYSKNGVRINDVSYASQGERSFLSLALSFALIHKSIKDYNIMLLDEIDATLDTRNRATFINILTQMIDLIDSEQVFMITHNNMFDSYPVDVIMTSDINLDSYKNANVIFKA
jgi:chromosome segregation ATPase